MTRTTIKPSRSTETTISPVRTGVRYGSDKRTIAAPHAHHRQPRAQASLSHQAIWWRGDGHPAFKLEWVSRQDMEQAARTHLAMIWEQRA